MVELADGGAAQPLAGNRTPLLIPTRFLYLGVPPRMAFNLHFPAAPHPPAG